MWMHRKPGNVLIVRSDNVDDAADKYSVRIAGDFGRNY
jgi:hypothetical protein